MASDAREVEHWLRNFIGGRGAVAGTVHVLGIDELELVAAVNIPPQVLEATTRIPKGRGMAGLAWERDEPVSTCNLKTDQSGDIRAGARAVAAHAAVALPIAARRARIRAPVPSVRTGAMPEAG